MLSRFGSRPFFLAGLLLTVGLATGNSIFLAYAAMPLLLLFGATLLRQPTVVNATIEPSRRMVYSGQRLTFKVHADVRPGLGPLDVFVKLPSTFRLTSGSNLVHRWASPGLRSVDYEFEVACDRRGIYELEPVHYETTHPTLLGAAQKGQAGVGVALRVQPRWSRLRRLRNPRTKSRTMAPEMDLSPTGVATTEFQEIREYHWGDPPRAVNWKASARLGERGDKAQLMVNEYEREGRKLAWVFLDAGQHDLIGTSLDNAFERRVEAAFTISSYFLDRGFSLGFSLFNSAKQDHLYPEQSSKQKRRILDLLSRIGPSAEAENLLNAVNEARSYMRRGRTVAFVVTSLGWTVDPLIPGLRRLTSTLGQRRGRLPVRLVHINPFGLVPDAQENELATVTSLLQHGSLKEIRKIGIRGIEWDPKRRSLAGLLRRVTV